MAAPSLGTSMSAHRDPEILLWEMIRVGEVSQAQSCYKMLMPEAKGLSHVKTRVCLEGPGWLQLAAVTQEGTQLTGPEYLTPLSLSQLICKSENPKATFFMGWL